jgi:AGZA family xanthine/uracil permease-like MFS transporter
LNNKKPTVGVAMNSRDTSRISRLFGFAEQRTTFRREIAGGATTFLAMSYIIFLQPAVLSQAGMDFGAVMVATCLSAALATLIMGLVANYPIALAPGMGENFFFAFSVVIGMGIAWPQAMGAVFYAGLLFLLLTILGARAAILNVIPHSLKLAMGVGIGFFITVIGLANAGIVIKNPGGLVQLGDVTSTPVWLALAGTMLTAIFVARKVPGAILLGILATTGGALALGLVHGQGIMSMPPSLAPTFCKLDFTPVLTFEFISVVFVFLFMDMFDTIGTLIGVSERAGFIKDGKLPRAGRAMMADSIGTVTGSLLGTSTVTSFVESFTGIEQGARTGFSNIIVAAGFLLALFFSPLVGLVGGSIEVSEGVRLSPVTAPALIIVGSLMAGAMTRASWRDMTESVPAFLVIIGIPLTYSIADGLAFGFVSYPILKVATGKAREVHWILYLIAVFCIARYAFFS